MRTIYLDNAATTRVDTDVVKAMSPYFTNNYGNASEPHLWGINANEAIENARGTIARHLNAHPDEIVFTSCATESINLSHKGLIESFNFQPHIITTSIEHKAVIETVKHLKASVTYLSVDRDGLISTKDLMEAITPNTVLVSVMYANNEIGTIEPIKEIGDILRKHNENHPDNRIYFHTDATQAIQYLDCDVNYLGVDMLSFTGHKIHAPKGIGALYIRKETPLIRQQDGGGQEFGLRAGTENVPYIVALGKAVSMINKSKGDSITKLRNTLVEYVLDKVPDSRLTGHVGLRVPHIASFTFKNVRGEDVVVALSERGIASASGSACTSGSIESSHVMKAIGAPDDWSAGQLRLSLSKYTTKSDVSNAGKELVSVIEKLRTGMF